MQNQRDTKIENKFFWRLDLLAYLESLDVEIVIGFVESPCFH